MKIITDQPQFKRKTLQASIGTSVEIVTEAPYFSVPLTDEEVAIVDPADPDRELRAGEVFFATQIYIANNTENTREVFVDIFGENGLTTILSPGLIVPPKDVLTLSPGLSLFKRDLDNPNNSGDRLRVNADEAGALTLTASVIEREAIDHAPDTEGL